MCLKCVHGLIQLQCLFLGKVRMASSSGSSGQPRKIILLRRNIEPSVKCEVVNEAVGYVYSCNAEDAGVNVC